MANLEKKGSNPTVILLANLFIYGALGYFLMGQKDKATKVFIVSFILSFVGGIGFIVAILAALDGKAVAEAVEAGEEVDEKEYKNELLFKIMKIIDKEAIYKAA